MKKSVSAIYEAPRPYWVGNGFPVRSLLNYHEHGEALSPFLLPDDAGPADMGSIGLGRPYSANKFI